jgi:hypothetical protein
MTPVSFFNTASSPDFAGTNLEISFKALNNCINWWSPSSVSFFSVWVSSFQYLRFSSAQC